jgi:hypothetical protein
MDDSRFFFPLRTNVEYFTTLEATLSFESRVKQALVLYDRVLFQAGLYVAQIGPTAAYEFHFPPAQMPSRSDLSRARRAQQRSEGFAGRGGGRQMLSSPTERSFQIEFHSLADRLLSLGIDGIEMVEWHLVPEAKRFAKGLAKEYRKSEGVALPEGSPRLQKRVVENLFEDLVLVSNLGCPSGVDSLHAPVLDTLIDRVPEVQAAGGFFALEFEVPHVAALSWEQIIEVREAAAVMEFRKHLTVAEETVRAMFPEAPADVIRQEVGSILHRELLRETQERMAPNASELAGHVVLELVGGLVPLIGTLHTAISVGQEVVDWKRERTSWLAVLMKLSRVDR